MIEPSRLVAAGLLAVLVLAACGRASAGSKAPSMAALQASHVALTDVTSVLPDAKNWWVGAPTFDVRPLNSSNFIDEDRYGVTQRFDHIGTREQMTVNFEVFSSTTFVTSFFSVTKQLSGNGSTGPKAGDQALYYTHKLSAGPAPYVNEALSQVGQTIVTVLWSHVDGYANTSKVGKVLIKATSRLKDVESGKVHPSPPPELDASLLAPNGPDLTLLGADRLPVQVISAMLYSADPTGISQAFQQQLGANDFVYGDYALNLDTHMEVLTAGFVFQNPNAAEILISTNFSQAELLAPGVAFTYDQATEKYFGIVGQGTRAVLIFCQSSDPSEAASRSCEGPLAHLMPSWKLTLNG